MLSVQVFGFAGDGLLRLLDDNASWWIATLDGMVTDPWKPSIHVVDVTELVRRSIRSTPGLLYFSPQLIVDFPAGGEDCGDGVKPCACGDRVVIDPRLDRSDPVLGTRCPCNRLVAASGVRLDVGGTIRSGGPDSCTDARVGLPAGIKIEEGASEVVVEHGQLIGFGYGVWRVR